MLPLGRQVPLRTLLYGLMLPSGNDAAIALAQHVAGSVGAFVRGMNQEAARLGLACTHYSSPSGYFNSTTTRAPPTWPSSPTSTCSSR